MFVSGERVDWLHCLIIAGVGVTRNGVVIERVLSILRELPIILERKAGNTSLDTRNLKSF